MGIFWSNLLALFRNQVVTTTTSNPNQFLLDFANGGQPTDSGIVVNQQTAMQSSAVYACVSIIAQSVASLPFNVIRKQGKRRIPEPENRVHLLIHESPNPFMTPVVFWELLMCNVLLGGNAYARIERTRGLEANALLPIHPSRVEVAREDGQRLYHVDLEDGGRETFQDKDMIHIPGLGFDGLSGLSVISFAAKQTIGLALAAEKHGSKMMANGARLSGVLKTKKRMSPEAKKTFKEHWQAAYGGTNATNGGGTPILEEDMDFTPISMTAEDAQFLETRRFQVEDISRYFRVPLHMINETSKSTSWGSGLEQLSIGFVQYTLRSWLVRVEQEITRKLLRGGLPRQENLSAKYSLEGLLRGDSAARAAFYASGIQHGWMMPNEARAFEDLEPATGGDQLFMQGAMVPIEQVGATPEPDPDPDPNPQPTPTTTGDLDEDI